MFLSNAVVPVLVFTVLLNFFYLFAPIDSRLCGTEFTTCEGCLKSPCHTQQKRPCIIDPLDNCSYACFTCEPNPSGETQYYFEEECTPACTDSAKKCVCDVGCWSCIATDGVDLSKYKCYMPTKAVDEKCVVVPYGP